MQNHFFQKCFQFFSTFNGFLLVGRCKSAQIFPANYNSQESSIKITLTFSAIQKYNVAMLQRYWGGGWDKGGF